MYSVDASFTTFNQAAIMFFVLIVHKIVMLIINFHISTSLFCVWYLATAEIVILISLTVFLES